jgi:hypothetical protein
MKQRQEQTRQKDAAHPIPFINSEMIPNLVIYLGGSTPVAAGFQLTTIFAI